MRKCVFHSAEAKTLTMAVFTGSEEPSDGKRPALMRCCVFLFSAAGCPVKRGGEDGWEVLSEPAGAAPGQVAQFFGNGNPFSAAALHLSGPRH